MFLLGHLGLTLALVVGARRWVDVPLDYRLLLVGALLPDLIDKPLSLVFGIGGRNIAHTLVFAFTLTALFLLLRARDSSKGGAGIWTLALLALAIGTWTHLLFDRMWALPETLLWPFLGLAFPVDPFDLFSLLEGYSDPYVLLGDILGGVALLYIAWRHRLYRPDRFRRFLRHGRLEREVPLSPAGPA